MMTSIKPHELPPILDCQIIEQSIVLERSLESHRAARFSNALVDHLIFIRLSQNPRFQNRQGWSPGKQLPTP